MGKWTVADIPDQSGRVVLVTGANSGLRFQYRRTADPQRVAASAAAKDPATARRLWEVSEELTGVHYEFAAGPAPATR